MAKLAVLCLSLLGNRREEFGEFWVAQGGTVCASLFQGATAKIAQAQGSNIDHHPRLAGAVRP